MTVQSYVIDVRREDPRRSDSLLIDSSVLMMVAYDPEVDRGWSGPYTGFIERAVEAGAVLWHCGVSLAEIAHSIEMAEFKTWWAMNRSDPLPNGFSAELKAYRQLPPERSQVCRTISRAWDRVNSWSRPLETSLGSGACANILSRLHDNAIDAYDALLLHAMRAGGVNQILTNDHDFGYLSGLEVFTAHGRLVREARDVGRDRRIPA